MKRCYAYAILAAALCMAPTRGDETAMKKALASWDQQMIEYDAARKVAKTEGQRAALREPQGNDIAKALWKAVSKRTGEREDWTRPSAAERMHGATDQKKMTPTYEFEEPWAAPAVAWFINHPQAFAQVFGDKPRQVSYFANALLESVARIHYNSPAIANACAKMAESPSIRVYEMLEKIYTRNQDPAARACAAMAMSIMLGNPALSSAEGSQAIVRGKRAFYLKQALNLAPEDTRFGAVSLSEAGIEAAYILRNLTAGCIPPKMRLTSVKGEPVLFPAPGKPNLILFWSPEEQIGLKLVTKTHLLLKQYPGLEFCPITANQDKNEWDSMLKEYEIPFCYMDDAHGTAGKAYRVAQLPTAVLVNDKCQIIYIGFPGLQLQTALDTLFNPSQENKIRVTIEEEPLIQRDPQLQPATDSSSNEAPALREMPEF